MWSALKTHFGKSDPAATYWKFESILMGDRLSDKKPLGEQLDKLQFRLREVADGGLTLDEHMKAMIILSKIPESYRNLVSGLLAFKKLTELSVSLVVEKTKAEENVRKTGIGGSSASRVSQTKPKPKTPCEHCGGKNHDESSCWKKYPEKKPKNQGGDRNKGKGKGKYTGHGHSHAAVESSASVLVSNDESEQSINASFYVAASTGKRVTHWFMDSGASEHITGDFADYDS